jgi:hypothetical protein
LIFLAGTIAAIFNLFIYLRRRKRTDVERNIIYLLLAILTQIFATVILFISH